MTDGVLEIPSEQFETDLGFVQAQPALECRHADPGVYAVFRVPFDLDRNPPHHGRIGHLATGPIDEILRGALP